MLGRDGFTAIDQGTRPPLRKLAVAGPRNLETSASELYQQEDGPKRVVFFFYACFDAWSGFFVSRSGYAVGSGRGSKG